MDNYKNICKVLDEMGNVSVALNAYESLPRRVKKINQNKMNKKMKQRRGE